MIARPGGVRYPDTMSLPHKALVQIEVSRYSFVKRRPNGSVDFVSPFPSLFSYGSVDGVMADDGDPQDALVIGCAPQRGEAVEYPVWGRVFFVDAGVQDHKWIVGPQEPSDAQWVLVERFFRLYAWAKRWMSRWRGLSGETACKGVERKPTVAG